jgi:hypothetical protein
MNERLKTVDPDLVRRLEGQDEPHLRQVAERIAEAATKGVDITDERVEHALAALRSGRFGDTQERESVKRLADDLDELAWRAQDRVEAGEAAQGEYLAAFRRARGVMSLWFALNDDPWVAATEAAYEACSALDKNDVREVVDTLT